MGNLSTPRVSVIIPTYNYAHFLAEAIDSVLAQTFRDFELMVVDDGSTDDTRQVVARFGDSLRYVYQENRGYSAARNVAIRQAQGDIIAFLDADDLWLPQKLEIQVDYFDRHPDVGLVSANCYMIDAEGTSLGTMPSSHSSGWLFEWLLVRGTPVRMPTVAVRRQCFEEVGLFDESLRTTADWDLWLRLSRKYPFGYIEQPLAKWRVHGANMHKHTDPKARDRITILDKVFSDPNLPATIERKRNKAYSGAHATIGKSYLYYADEFGLARQHLLRAVRLYPFHLIELSLASSIVKAFLGPRLLAKLRAWKRRLRSPEQAMEPSADV